MRMLAWSMHEDPTLTLLRAEVDAYAQNNPSHDEEGGHCCKHKLRVAFLGTAAVRAALLLLMYTGQDWTGFCCCMLIAMQGITSNTYHGI